METPTNQQHNDSPISMGWDSHESELQRKFGREKARPFSAVQCEFSDDAGLIFQYKTLCGNAYRLHGEMVWAQEGSAATQTMLAYAGRLCVGGGQITLHTPDQPTKLPMERFGIAPQQLFPVLDLQENCYGEISGIVTLANIPPETLLQLLLQGLVKVALFQQADYVFSLLSYGQARKLQHCAHHLGIPMDMRHSPSLPNCPEFEGVKMMLVIFDVAKYRHAMMQITKESLIMLNAEA